jgi:hypothetical protein
VQLCVYIRIISANVHSKVMTGQDPLPSQILRIDLEALPAALRRVITKAGADGLNGPASGRAHLRPSWLSTP